MADKSNLDKAIEAIKKEGLEDIALIATSKDNKIIYTRVEAETPRRAKALIGMLIKMVAEDSNQYSPDLAEEIRDALEQTEQKFKKEVEHKPDIKVYSINELV